MPIPAGSGSGPAPDGLSYDPVLSRVWLSKRVPPSTLGVVVDRSTDGVRWATVRGAAELDTPNVSLVSVSDYEFTADVVNQYRLRAYASGGVELGPALNVNPYFEADTAGWVVAGGGTIVRSTAQAHEGAASLLVTPDGVSASSEARAELVPATAGVTYRALAWLRCSVSRSVGVGINWYQAGGAFISQSTVSVAVVADTWTLAEMSATAPALTGQARMLAGMTGTPPTSHTMHVDEACLIQVGGRIFTGSITPTLDGVWLKNLARPFLNRQVVVVDHSEVERPARSGVFDVIGRSYPVAVSDVRGSRRWTLEVLTETAADAADFDLVLASGDPMFIHVPADVDVPGGYVTVGDTTETRTGRRSPRRIFRLPCVEVAAPGPDVVGATSNWQTVINTYATWQDVLDAHTTWQSLLELIGSPTDVIVS